MTSQTRLLGIELAAAEVAVKLLLETGKVEADSKDKYISKKDLSPLGSTELCSCFLSPGVPWHPLASPVFPVISVCLTSVPWNTGDARGHQGTENKSIVLWDPGD